MTQLRVVAIALYLIVMLPLVSVYGEDSLDIKNTAQPIGKNQWRWTAFVIGPSDQIAKIACVEYILHPTFPRPIQKICSTDDPSRPFALTATGWGTFSLRARIEFKDGRSEEISHYLRF